MTMPAASLPWPWIKAVHEILSGPPWTSEPMPVPLLQWLYLSDLSPVYGDKGRRILLENGITHVLSANHMPPGQLQQLRISLEQAGLRHCYVEGQDESGFDMIGRHWDECRAFLEEAKTQEKSKVLVHCLAGQNRSGLIAAAAMMVLERKPLLQVVRDLKSKRGIVLTNTSFQKQLCILASQEDLLGDWPAQFTDEPAPWLDRMTKPAAAAAVVAAAVARSRRTTEEEEEEKG